MHLTSLLTWVCCGGSQHLWLSICKTDHQNVTDHLFWWPCFTDVEMVVLKVKSCSQGQRSELEFPIGDLTLNHIFPSLSQAWVWDKKESGNCGNCVCLRYFARLQPNAELRLLECNKIGHCFRQTKYSSFTSWLCFFLLPLFPLGNKDYTTFLKQNMTNAKEKNTGLSTNWEALKIHFPL